MPPSVADIEPLLDGLAQMILESVLDCAVVGSSDTVARGLAEFTARHSPDELMITAQIYDHDARLQSPVIASRCGVL